MNKVLWVLLMVFVAVGVLYIFGTRPAEKQELDLDVKPQASGKYSQAPTMNIDQNKNYSAVLETSKGTLKIELFPKEAPKTVNNFVFLAREKFYDGLVFHRIIKDFMIQGGDPNGDGTGGPGYKFGDEPVTRKYVRGTLAMANSGPNTNGSQFFIIHKDYELPKQYTIFGKIPENDLESLKILDLIAETPVEISASGEASNPKEEVKINSITIIEN